MVDAIVYDLLKQLASITTQQAKEEIKLIVGVDEEVQELKHKLRIIQAMLDNEEERQLKQHVENHWLAQLKDAYYEMDDVLDSWNTARIKLEIEKEEGKSADSNAAPAMKQKKVCSFLPSLSCCFRPANNLALRHDIGHKIKKLNETLDKIDKDKVLTRQLEVVPVDPLKTTSFVDASNIIGRDNNKAHLLRSLLDKGSQEERKPRVISLVGMGGLGKTTLAQLAYNDPEVKAHFEQCMWVCVSDPFDQCRVAKAIIQEIDPKILNNITELQSLLCKISGLIEDKKFFLVLDDVWTEDSSKWEPFRDALKCGAKGSRILITTRKLGVAEMMASAPINLEVLSEEDCWLMFSKIAFSNEDQRKDLEDLGRQLAIKCKGLPLAVKTLGSLMHKKTSREQWKNILASSLWELEGVERGVFAPLFLSYYDLPSPMKRCFSYCATFPKDYNFYKYELVLLWMAQGYIDSKENMEMKAEEYFEVLAMRSFFQDFGKDENDGRIDVIFPSLFPVNGGDVILPKGIGKLTSLKTLRDFYICGKDEREECKVGELKNLDELRVLRINGLRNVVDVSEAENAQLKKKKYLRHLILKFGGFQDEMDERVLTNDVLTLNALEPHPDLEILGIICHLGTTVYPNWMMSLTKLKILTLKRFPKLESLPPLGKLPSLERLYICYTESLKKVGVEFLGIESKNKKDDIIFPRLKSLLFSGLNYLEEWIGFEGMREEKDNGITRIMPRLQQLQIWDCKDLKSLPDFLRTTPLKELKIDHCPILSKRCERGIGEEWPKISHIPNIKIDIQREEEEEEDGYIL
uniref:NB-ARC domain-containing protein n=1 Tax=Fagus sylvatica TaxID=28930 RepID=A0A2N9F8V0_FAGSY